MNVLEDGPLRKLLREGLTKHSPEEAKRLGATEYWWVLPDFDFIARRPVPNLEEGLRILKDQYLKKGIVIHIDQAWSY